MGILEDLRDGKPCRWTGVCGEMSAVGGCTCGEAADEIELLRKERDGLRETLQKIADIEHEDIPSPKTPTEGIMWTVLAMAVGLAEDALKEEK